MQALIEYEKGICTNCGVHHSLVEADDFYWTFEERVCAMCASAAQHHRSLDADDKKAIKALGEDPDPLTPLPDDGRTVIIREMSAAEVAKQEGDSRLLR